MFDYPGEYAAIGAGETLAKIRMEEMQAEHETAHGETAARGLAVGVKFELGGFPSEYQNKAWLMIDAARLRRTDGALVRMITPVVDTPGAAFDELTGFAAALYSRLKVHVP